MSTPSNGTAAAGDAAGAPREVPDFPRALARLLLELDRARRFEHPLAAVVLSADGEGADATRFGGLGLLLARELRAVDVVGAAPAAWCYGILLAETDRRGAEQCVRRLDALVRRGGIATLSAGIAEFPRDGFTIDVLFECAAAARLDVAALAPADQRPRRVSHG